ncbi:ATP-binding cassette sub-family F member [Fasciola gigantica]|uniref:ATP-binding cassette sub-family F member n=1 Tax=Fasciola gigantica TaxID=46835 RepID=A0A504YKA3_FASGI|nr:ATP-binding cassette sub-family F member [Fasciola gigantica]
MGETDQVQMAVELFREAFPLLDKDVKDYVEGVLVESGTHFDTEADVHDAIGGLLNEFSCGTSESQIDELCKKIYALMKPTQVKTGDYTLDAPVHMASILDTFSGRLADNRSIWMVKKEVNSVVDPKKLGKAEAKLREKHDKKSTYGKLIGHSSSSSLKNMESAEDFATVSQQLDRRDLNASADASGRHVGDIRLENFDIAFGSRMLLQGASLTVSYGRRYGLIGRNGYGKTTLLRALARGDLRLPVGLRVLHVEQEMTGDSTSALESVLRADTERATLLAELSRLQSTRSADNTSVTDESVESGLKRETISGDRLTEIYTRLAAIEADKAPARAAVILHGLGFNTEMQQRPTKQFSGGWRMRLSLAQALFAKPDLLLLDEPTNMLDMRALIWLEGYVQTSSNIMIIVSHDRSFLNTVATDIIHLNARRLDVYRGNYDAFEQARGDRLLAQQREYEALKAEREHIQQFIDKFRYNAKRASLVQSRIKQLERLPPLVPPEKDPVVQIRLPVCDKLSSPVLRLDEVSFHYVPDKPICGKVDLSHIIGIT